ncbi:hypothetical protein CERSUDRAFT_86245 [Gelatoporia subvermispora B]|uniref:RBR-type E3 ubiquitin transferase n=1 Tax=Ceriporiopsis subvermispora (strain B) TaxID=914234 RepID=M2PFV0_CERS8|nr:hypothetical protein CERSUDRAFT_86245 [Gelatoporia subvermispora B]
MASPSITCVVCMDTISDVDIIAPCGHHYDKDCILLLFERATEDESLFPPRCCSEKIPLVTVHAYMSADLLQRFREKSEEFSTLKRVYCANPACSHFLGPQQEFTSLLVASKLTPTTKTCTAPRCTTMTCMRCKSAVNGAEHWCVEDVQDLQILELGREAGWARCPGCKVMIERNSGCSHMSCRCGTQFCYCCGERWKTCSCGPYGPATRRRRRTARPRGVVQARQEPALPRSVQDDGLPQNLQSLMVNGRQESAPMLPVDARFVGIAANTENTSRQPAANLPTVSAVRYSSASLWAPPAPTLTTMLLPVVPSVQPAPAQYWFPPMPSPRQHPVHSELPPLPSIGELAGRDFAPAWTPTDTSSVVTSSSPAQPRSSRRRVAHLPTAIIPPAVSLTVRPEPTHLDHPYVHTTMMLPAAPSVAAHAQFGYSASQIMMMRAVASPARARYTHLGHPSSHAAVMPSVAAAEQQWTMR